MTEFWRAVLYLHLLSMAFFVGGQLVFGAAVVPLLRGDGDREKLRAIARRFGFGSLGTLW
jgi:putative copper export protein